VNPKIKERWERAARDPGALIQELKKARGQKAVGMVLTDVPAELVHAAGAMPVALLGRETPFRHADKRLQGFACAYSRTLMELMENGSYDFLDGIITPYACDTTRCLDLIIKYINKYAYQDCLRLPKRTAAEGVDSYFRAELKRLGQALGRFTGVEPNQDRLSHSIALFNRVRARLRELRAGGMSTPQYLTLVRGAMTLPPEETLALLEQTGPASPAGVPGRFRVVVAGKVPMPEGLLETIEAAGLTIIEDHLVVAGRWVAADVPEGADPWEGLTQRQLSMLPFAGIWDGRPSRAAYLLERVRLTNAHGAIFLLQKFCEPAELDVPGIREEAEKQGVPLLVLESDYSPAGLPIIKTRVEAFAEMLTERQGER
jgi:benzoyl-CoA reductase/2-hydroxyglutaryl-CoA dehydratase subunit BcrC/BadD/HgdB